MVINEIDQIGREAGEDNGPLEIGESRLSVRCRSADQRWCLLCRHSNGVLDVERLRQMRDVYLQRRLDGNEKPEYQRGLANIDEALTVLKASSRRPI